MKMLKSTLAVLTATAILGVSSFAQAGATLDAIQKKGFIQCGVSDGLPGFSVPDSKGVIQGIDADFCRAVAAAVFGDATKVKFSQLNAKERFTALQSGEIDILSRNTTWTSSRDASMGLVFPGFVTYYDGVGFLANTKLGVKSAKELDGATICIQAGTTTELNVSDYFRANNLKYTPITFDTSDESAKSLESGRCDVLTSDKSQLYAQRSKLASPKDYVVLPETISKEPLGPVVRKGDEDWMEIVRWTGFALLNTEEAGVTSKNVMDLVKNGKNPDVARLLGVDGEYGKDLKLPKDWVVKIVSQVGNYGEIFEKNLGKGTALAIDRGMNALWTNGGIQYAPPVR
ncbi:MULTISPECIES: amino acid ABC transporter substrate-binding protein [unclassified Pseudomonas]|uniref:amino acid ABC transporter substrate-binding protein n=1 Tax=unclassified Pseudomonas TaxID=196821 RepID=UPI002AC90B2E|nr:MULTISPECIES: amino acid ABC transporter substrate-binding protein [unclassified Pseudomonas]MEB0042928.1 amino acid ABC transporter substrate-binding protein [Pseudomonas sp. MH10]MEB0077625.1 amino acid ABC transporter substrate-binding protein [Pseudomonas sp. MH10out]MEB0089631.1 amino acid ABC transporter substrate-binding protein [Pseudomonas sp. CCI4.2]MEB0101810.1 amino acid ABC transporter substrate-binding protein [Pseudomonas sp. CCI3.2]MEB0121617.1 amino acid ABC transporter sub